jgi:hypothetical protein
MFQALNKPLIALAALALILGSAVALQPPSASADIADGVWFLDDFDPDAADACSEGDPREVRVFDPDDPDKVASMITEDDGIDVDDDGDIDQVPIIQIAFDDELIICVEPEEEFNVTFDTSGAGDWDDAKCGDLGTECIAEEGVGDDALTVVASSPTVQPLIALTFTCNAASVQSISITQDDANGGDGDEFDFRIMCKGEARSIGLTVTPETVIESSPAVFNTAHALIQAVITDAAGNPVLPGTEVDFTVDRCAIGALDPADREEALDLFEEPPIEDYVALDSFANTAAPPTGLTASAETVEIDTNIPPDGVPNHSEALAILHAEGCAPGPVTITVTVEVSGADVEATHTITVVGPVAFITLTAAPTELVCGEKAEITVSATDALNQGVSDHTRIELVTNYGGVLAGTGSSLTIGQPVNPLSSTAVELFDGAGTAYLITSPEHVGPYEVLAASTIGPFSGTVEDAPRVTAQVTVTCTLGTAPAVVAPDTGTGTIRPPNTGDAGLAASSAGTAPLYVIAGAVAFVLAGFASFGFARR